jgi:signal transduction histidine kinase
VATDPPRGVGKRAAATRLRPKPLDMVFAVLCVPATIIGALVGGDSFGALEIAVIVVSATLILLRHYAPIPVLAAAIGASIASVAVTDHPNVLIAVVVLLVFTVAAEHDRRTAIYAGLAGIAGLLVVVVIQNPPDQLLGPVLAAVAWPALAVAGGDLLRTRREAITAADERARRAEETREAEARRRVAEERLHIARELHDVVAHHMPSSTCRPASPTTCCAHGQTTPPPRSVSCARQRRPRSTTWGARSTCSAPPVRATPRSSPRRR